MLQIAIIITPTLTAFTEFEMLSSKAFKRAGHRLFSIWIRNHNKNDKVTLADEFELPKGIMTTNKVKVYRERVNENREIKVKVDNIEPKNGIEIFQDHIENSHPGIDFYVLEMVTQTIGKIRNTLLWRRHPASASNANIVSLHLIKINGKKTLEHYSQEEMWEIVGSLPDDKCRLRTEVREKTCIICDPVDN